MLATSTPPQANPNHLALRPGLGAPAGSGAWREARVQSSPGEQLATPPVPSDTELAQLREALAGYELEKLIGCGSNGVVYRGTWTAEQTTVAIKIQHSSANCREKARFLREIRAIAKLRHQHIVRIYEGGTCTVRDAAGNRRELSYFTMQYVAGADLGRLLDSKTAELGFLIHTLIKIARALQFAHWHGFVHRDVKPSNILLDRTGKPYLIDFGFAKKLRSDPRVTELGTTVGTPAYMAPEQALGKQHKLCPASDVFSLGAILYEMLTGKPPHQKDSLMASVRALVKEPVVPPSVRDPQTPPALERICLRALRKKIADRYASAAEFADDLEEWLTGVPISSSAVGMTDPASGWLMGARAGWRKTCQGKNTPDLPRSGSLAEAETVCVTPPPEARARLRALWAQRNQSPQESEDAEQTAAGAAVGAPEAAPAQPVARPAISSPARPQGLLQRVWRWLRGWLADTGPVPVSR